MEGEAVPLQANLIEKGWHPGVIFAAPGASFSVNHLAEGGNYAEIRSATLSVNDRLVLISHECDVVSPDEPYIEALACDVVPPDDSRLVQWDRNSARRFVINFELALVANAARRIKIAKHDLPDRHDGCPMDERRYRQFVDWLGARYTRPVVPDNIARDFLNPVRALFKRWKQSDKQPESSILDSLEQVRFRIVGESVVGLLYVLKYPELEADFEDNLNSLHQQVIRKVVPKITIEEGFELDSWYEVPNGQILSTLELTGVDYLTAAGAEEADDQ